MIMKPIAARLILLALCLCAPARAQYRSVTNAYASMTGTNGAINTFAANSRTNYYSIFEFGRATSFDVQCRFRQHSTSNAGSFDTVWLGSLDRITFDTNNPVTVSVASFGTNQACALTNIAKPGWHWVMLWYATNGTASTLTNVETVSGFKVGQ